MLLSALGTWVLLRRIAPAPEAVRLLALAERFSYIRSTPTMLWERIVPAAEEAAPGLLAKVQAEYADRQPAGLLAEAHRLAERLPSGGAA
jgi:HPt (histidine-containing phosphotransfer) domain-containing protein